MKNEKLQIKIILGSTRPGRFSEHPGRWIFELAKKQDNIEPELLDLRDYPLPFYDESVAPASVKEAGFDKESVRKWSQKITKADGFIIVAPEYNHGYTAVLKNALDYIWYPWNQKPVAFVAYGNTGGARVVEQLREVAVELEMVSTRRAVHIMRPWTLLKEDKTLKDGALDSYVDGAEKMLEELVWWGNVLKSAREEI